VSFKILTECYRVQYIVLMNGFSILLVSGLPLAKSSSFKRQLELLGRFFGKRNIQTTLIGPETNINGVVKNKSINAALLLGYPDQFPFLKREKDMRIPVYLWAQLSKPVDSTAIGSVIPIPLTPITKEFLEESGVDEIGPIIPHGVDTEIFYPFSRQKRETLKKRYGFEGCFVVGTVGANTTRKRLEKVIEAFSYFSAEITDSILFIKTDRKKDIEGTDLGEIAQKSGVSGKVEIVEGEFDEPKMAEVYNLMDVYITLSEWEGFCIPVIEAMACGVPVITHEVQGPGEIVPYRDLIVPGSRRIYDGKTLLLHSDPIEASRVIKKAYESRSLLTQLGELGRKEVKNRYDIRVVAKKWEELFQSGANS
jgi:glycosyltransferase involved in cell wall biosynthesis